MSGSLSRICWSFLVLQLLQWQILTAYAYLTSEQLGKCNLASLTSPKTAALTRPSFQQYSEMRRNIWDCELKVSTGSGEVLNADEKTANATVMSLKYKEYINGLQNPHDFTPSHSIMASTKALSQSTLFKFIKNMPKGALLHAHEGSIGNKEFLKQLTYDENVWVCWKNTENNKLRFFMTYYATQTPVSSGTKLFQCTWSKMADLRKEKGKDVVDQIFMGQLSMENLPSTATENEAVMFVYYGIVLLKNLLLYQPNFEKYVNLMLQEAYNDGIQYMEIRAALLPVNINNTYCFI